MYFPYSPSLCVKRASKAILLFAILMGAQHAAAQSVGIGTNMPDPSAKLDISSTNQGFLMPRLTTAQRLAISNPVNGLIVYDVNLGAFYYYQGTQWLNVSSSGAQGPQGPVGPQGPTGVKGDTGAQGDAGAVGPQGPAGAQGSIGPAGPQGPQGVQGSVGPVGPQGVAGSNGAPGAQGPTGPTGAQGNVGPQGPAGSVGPVGPQGPAGSNGSAGAQGPAGPQGPQGAAGILPAGITGATPYYNGSAWVTNSTNIYNSGTNVGIGAGPQGAGEAKLVVSRDGANACCGGGNATLALADVPASGHRASISFHNSGESEGELELTQAATGVGAGGQRRIRFFDHQSENLGLELTGNLWYGNNNSRSQTRLNAGLQGDAGAQSGFYEAELSGGGVNYPAGASGWWHFLDVRHSNNSNNYAMQFAGSFFDQNLYFRKTAGNGATGWSRVLTTNDEGNFIRNQTAQQAGSNFNISGDGIVAGNVGIGTAPASKLHVMGRTHIHQAGGGGGQNRFEGLHPATDANGRAQLILSSAYSDLVVASSQLNGMHGSTVSLVTYNPDNAGDYRKWVINQGNWGARDRFLDFGYGANYPNPHSPIGAGSSTMSLDGTNRRVGINQVNPGYTLHVSGTTELSEDVTVDGVKPFWIKRFYLPVNTSSNYYYTGISTATYTAVIAGLDQGYYDMRENDNQYQDACYMYKSGGYWYIRANANSHNNAADFMVDVMFIKNEFTQDTER